MQKILIVGGGLAGSCLSFQLVESGCEVALIDNGVNVSSRVAAGIVNPLVFRRMTKSWRADELIPYARDFYGKIERQSGNSFFHPITIRRFFSSEQERNFWIERQSSSSFSEYMHPINAADEVVFPYANQFGSGRVKNSFYLNTELLLDTLHARLAPQIRKELFDYEQLNPETATYNDEQFDAIVFCEGYQSKNNPWFGHLPVSPTKGEILTVETDGLSEDESLNRKCFTLHTGAGKYKVGSTYVWDIETVDPTEEGKQLILENLKYLTDRPVSVVAQCAGIRPTTPDRRPVMGRHSVFDKLIIFNGLGAKGYMMAPFLSQEMCNHLINKTALNHECRIDRFRL